MSARQVVRVFSSKTPNTVVEELQLPDVFLSQIRSDIIQDTFVGLSKNRRQP